MTNLQGKTDKYWSIASELPASVFDIWRKANRTLSPAAIVATIDADGKPRIAPFGSLRAITTVLFRLCVWSGHDTHANLLRDGRVAVSLISPGIAVSVRGMARMIKKRMEHDPQFSIFEIDVYEVKNDMAYKIFVESGISISPRGGHEAWYDSVMAELESIKVDESKLVYTQVE